MDYDEKVDLTATLILAGVYTLFIAVGFRGLRRLANAKPTVRQ